MNKKTILIFMGLALFLIAFSFVLRQNKKENLFTQKIMVGDKELLTAIARTQKEQEQGLSNQKSLCSNCGMLFLYDQQYYYTFWMIRMYFDIDIIWINEDTVVDITYDAKKPPADEFEKPKTFYTPKTPADKVLEVNSGWAEKNGIKVGDKIQI